MDLRKLESTLLGFLTSPRVFLAFAFVLLSYNGLGLVLLYTWHGDYWEHLAIIGAFVRDPLYPSTPYVASDMHHLFTPYHLFWGVVARGLHSHPFYLLPAIGTINLGLFLIAARLLSDLLFGSKQYGLVIALSLLFLWYKTWGWSGFPNFGQLPLTSVYPYWFAFSLTLILLSIVGCNLPQIGLHTALIIVSAVALVFLVHPLSGFFLVISLEVLALTRCKRFHGRQLTISACVAIGLGVALLWPYYRILDTILFSTRYADVGFAGEYKLFYQNFPIKIAPALPGVAFIAYSFTRGKPDFVGLGFLSFVGVYSINYVLLHSPVLSRSIIFLTIYLQLAFVSGVILATQHRLRLFLLSGFVGSLLVFGVLQGLSSFRWLGVVVDLRNGAKIGTHSNVRLFWEYRNLSRIIQGMKLFWQINESHGYCPGLSTARLSPLGYQTPFLPIFLDGATM